MDALGILTLIGFTSIIAADNNTATVPSVLSNPPVLSVPSVQSLPSEKSLPSTPSLPSVPSVPTVASVPSVPSVPSVASVPSAPAIPSTCTDSEVFMKNPRECCRIPEIFNKTIFLECGYSNLPPIEAPVIEDAARTGPSECHKTLCVLKKYNFTKAGDVIDKEKFSMRVEEWAQTHTTWKSAVEKVKERCLENDIPGHPGACEASKIMFCATQTLMENCPLWEDSEECNRLKKQIEQCPPFQNA